MSLLFALTTNEFDCILSVMNWELIGVIATVIFGIVAIIAIIVAVRLARKKVPVWAHRTQQLIGLGTNAPPELKLTFNAKPIVAVFQTTLIFFNRGNEAIRRGDVTDKVAFRFPGAEILRDPTIKPNKPEIRMSAKHVITRGDHAVELNFEYLAHNDGAIIEVLHTNFQSIEHQGNIIDSKEIQDIGYFPLTYPRLRRLLLSTSGLLAVGAVGVVLLIRGMLASKPENSISEFVFPSFFILFGLLSILEFLPYFRARRFPKWSMISRSANYTAAG